MATIGEIRTALADHLKNVSGLRVYPRWPDQVHIPCAIVMPVTMEYHRVSGNDGSTIPFDVVVLVGQGGQGIDRAQQELDQYLDFDGNRSLRKLLDDAPTLGGIIKGLLVTSWQDYGPLESGGIEYFGARIRVEVWT